VAVLLLFGGFDYYFSDDTEKFWHTLHKKFNPAGIIGLWFGVLGSVLLFAGVVLYSIRKRFKKFRKYGSMKQWLNMHLICCTVGPILILYHTSFKFGGLVSVSFWSMVFVFISGIFGKFYYTQIPRSIKGELLSYDEIEKKNRELTAKLLNEYKLKNKVLQDLEKLSSPEMYKKKSLVRLIIILFKNIFFHKRKLALLEKEIKNVDDSFDRVKFLKLAKAKIIFSRKIGLLNISRRVLKNWRQAHINFTIIMFIILVIHIFITLLYGYNLVLY
tara:strand:+ start:17413 stop:18231 length:819 start_codon:yes stop_codon:yes gene_type:complete